MGIPPRRVLRRGQTPQGFRLNTIKAAYDEAARANQRLDNQVTTYKK